MIRGTTAPVFNLTLALKNVTDSNQPAPSSSSSSSYTPTTAGYRDHPIHSVVQEHVSGCLEGYGFLYFVFSKKREKNIVKNLSQPSDPRGLWSAGL